MPPARQIGFNVKIGVALSGGGFRGVAHIGVLKALNERKIPIDMICGTSMGGVIAALYAAGYNPDEIKEIVSGFEFGILNENNFYKKVKNVFNKSTLKTSETFFDGILNGNKIEKYLKDVFLKKGVEFFEDVRLPLVVPSVDINTMKTVMFVSNKNLFIDNNDCVHLCHIPIWEALRATISIPVVFKPRMISDFKLVDGGIKNNLPISGLKTLGAKRILAVSITCDYPKCKADNMIDIFLKTIDFMSGQNIKCVINGADCALELKFQTLNQFEFDKLNEFVSYGYNLALNKIDTIEKNLLLRTKGE